MAAQELMLFFVILILLALGMTIYLLLQQQRQPKTDNAATQQLIMGWLNELRRDMQDTGGKNRVELQQRLDHILQYIANQQQHTAQQLMQQQRHHTTITQQLTEQLSTVAETNKQILGFAEQMQHLERILQNPKQRGVLGEYFLETLLANVLSNKQYKMQYRFDNGEIVDAAIFVRDKIVPIDAKFSLEKFNKMTAATDDSAKNQWEKMFRSDLKQRIDETAKYIRPHQQTTDFAIMFVPAEGIFHHLLNHNVQQSDVIAYAFSKRVVIVSPMSFYAYLQTILQGLKALEIEQSVKEVIQTVNSLHVQLQQYETLFADMGKQLQRTQNTYNETYKEWKKIDKSILKIEDHTQKTTLPFGENITTPPQLFNTPNG